MLFLSDCNKGFVTDNLTYKIWYKETRLESSAEFEVVYIKRKQDTILIIGKSGGGFSGVNFEIAIKDREVIKEKVYSWSDIGIGAKDYKLTQKQVYFKFNGEKDSLRARMFLSGKDHNASSKLVIKGEIYKKVQDSTYHYRTALADTKFEKILQVSDEEMSQKEYLDLSKCSLTEIPGFIVKYKNLKSLNLSSNNLSEVINWGILCKLKKLEYLTLTNVDLLNIPKEFECLENLKELNLISNKIRSLPSYIIRLENLSTLQVGLNKIEHIDLGVLELNKLTNLNLMSNPVAEISMELINSKKFQNLIIPYNSTNLTRILKEIKGAGYSYKILENMNSIKLSKE